MDDAQVWCEYMTGRVPCNAYCRHQPGLARTGVVCPFAERQDVADNGPAPFLPAEQAFTAILDYIHNGDENAPVDEDNDDAVETSYAKVEAAGEEFLRSLYGTAEPEHVGEFGRAADRTLAEVKLTYEVRGNSYGDTWAVDAMLSELQRLDDSEALIRVKMRRALMTGMRHRDSLVDLIAYAAAYVTWGDEYGGWWDE
jgi:hypothetical protein